MHSRQQQCLTVGSGQRRLASLLVRMYGVGIPPVRRVRTAAAAQHLVVELNLWCVGAADVVFLEFAEIIMLRCTPRIVSRRPSGGALSPGGTVERGRNVVIMVQLINGVGLGLFRAAVKVVWASSNSSRALGIATASLNEGRYTVRISHMSQEY